MALSSVRIVGIDPGLRCTGWGIVDCQGARLSFVACGHLKSTTGDPLAYRLRELYEGLGSTIATFHPDEAAVEETFVNDNPRATLKLGQARGMALLAPALLGLQIAEYPPNLVKKAVVGAGHADKNQVQAMIGYLLPKAKFETADEADALAIAICHAHHRRQNVLLAEATKAAVR
ncbi:MAG: crossover junction endodeoxyribonuclease RuvC [Alphaproteobacteria bacterium]|nr:crossover junction endodeoxyribonuclease RuvC [Alphaproteobacteria bacterium]